MLNQLRPYINYRSAIYFFSLIAGWPCVFYLMGWLPHYTVNYILLLVLAGFFVISRDMGPIPAPASKIMIAQMVMWALYAVVHADTSYFTRILMIAITFLILRMQYTDRYPLRFAKIFTGWVALQVVLGAIGVILVFAIGLQPLFEFKEMDFRTGYCFGLFTTNTYVAGLDRIKLVGAAKYIGSHSYWLYLWHIPFVDIVGNHFDALGRFCIIFTGAMMCVVLQNYMVDRFVESNRVAAFFRG